MTVFAVTLNGGRERKLKVKTGMYVSAAAAAPAVFGVEADEYPVMVKIWTPDLLPDYGPYFYTVERPGGSANQYIEVR